MYSIVFWMCKLIEIINRMSFREVVFLIDSAAIIVVRTNPCIIKETSETTNESKFCNFCMSDTYMKEKWVDKVVEK